MTRSRSEDASISRRRFLATGGAAMAAGGFSPMARAEEAAETPRITRYRTLGRTGFRVSDVSLGCGHNTEPNVYRYAYDHGMNYFDNAEGYANGESERALGEALQHMDRAKVFITSKTEIKGTETEQVIDGVPYWDGGVVSGNGSGADMMIDCSLLDSRRPVAGS